MFNIKLPTGLSSFQVVPKSFLGIDIGTSAIKVVEISKWGNRNRLENYGEIRSEFLYQKQFRTFEKSTLTLSTADIAKGIKAIFEETGIKNKKAYMSLPDFASFFTWFELPPMTEEEVPQAVASAARQYIPLPLSEVTLDWQIIEGRIERKTPLKVLLVAVPNEVINQFQEIASLTKIELHALEAEVFGLIRSVTMETDKDSLLLLDVGARSTTISVADGQVLKRTHSFDMAGTDFVDVISKSMGVDYQKAEELKKKYGISAIDNKNEGIKVREVLLPLVDLIISEAGKISQNYFQIENKMIQKAVLAGGEALMPGFADYFSERLKISSAIANPFSNLFFTPILEKDLKLMGPGYAIAVGMALGGLE
ncbi:MAG: type IV pilus assembly protein PilM [Candidatus Nealsonbacteria bacterium]|nr:type IV pilus assembly protein PilM [Candidatus Nealsonbacteria bacterium]